jgi:hypothetical protein
MTKFLEADNGALINADTISHIGAGIKQELGALVQLLPAEARVPALRFADLRFGSDERPVPPHRVVLVVDNT